MLKKPIRAKHILNQDRKQPQTISELIRRYDLDNIKIYDFLDYLIEKLNNEQIKNTNNYNIAIAYNNESQNVNAQFFTFTLTGMDLIGDKLKLENGKVIIGKGVKKIKVSATAFFENINSTNIAYVWLFISHNGERKSNSIASGVSIWFQSLVISDCILDVKENDYLELIVNNPNWETHIPTIRGGKENTRLYVEVIE